MEELKEEQRIQGAKAMPICITFDDGFRLKPEVYETIMKTIMEMENMNKYAEFFTEKQRQDIAFFKENIKLWADNPLYRLKFFVISGKEIRGFYDTFETALRFAVVNFGAGGVCKNLVGVLLLKWVI